MTSVTTAAVAEDDEMADINANDTNRTPNPIDPTTATTTTTNSSSNNNKNKNDSKIIPAATASMCFYCFDVLFYEMYQQQQKQQQQQASSHVSFPFTKSFRSNSQTTTADIPTASSTSVIPLSKPIIHPIVDQLVQNNNCSSSDDHPPHPVHNHNNNDPPTTIPPTVIECPLFVTWEKQKFKKTHSHTTRHCHSNDPSAAADDDDEYELRGCIGSLAPKRIDHDHLNHFIRASAFHDTRFTPISYHPHNGNNNNNNNIQRNNWREICSLRVSISLLVQYERCRDCYDWVIGQHGIIIKFTTPLSSSYTYSATFLPEVASQQSWDHATTLRQLIHKTGYTGPISSSLLQSIHCTRYQSSKYSMTFRQYVELYHTLQQQSNPYTNLNPILMDIITRMNDPNYGTGHDPQPPTTNTPRRDSRDHPTYPSTAAISNPDQTPPHNCHIM